MTVTGSIGNDDSEFTTDPSDDNGFVDGLDDGGLDLLYSCVCTLK
jgi:hypothetical protein